MSVLEGVCYPDLHQEPPLPTRKGFGPSRVCRVSRHIKFLFALDKHPFLFASNLDYMRLSESLKMLINSSETGLCYSPM